MRGTNTLKAVLISLVVFVVVFVALSGLFTLLHHGFSASDNPAWLETAVAQTMRNMAVPAKAKATKNPVPNKSGYC